MKILYIITRADGGGAQKYVLALARHFGGSIAAGHSTLRDEPLGSDSKSDEAERLFDLADGAGLQTYRLKYLKRGINLWNDFLACVEIRQLVKHLNPDIVHLNSTKAGILGSFACIGLKTKAVFTAHGFIFNEPLGFALKNFYLALEKIASDYRDFIITVSDADKNSALANNLIKPDKITTIHNGIGLIDFLTKDEARHTLKLSDDEKPFSGTVDVSPLPLLSSRAKPNASEDESRDPSTPRLHSSVGMTHPRVEPSGIMPSEENKIIIGTIANFYKTKGLDVLIKAMSLLDDNIKQKVHLAIIGSGPEFRNLELGIRNYGLEQTVKLLGKIDNTAQYLRAFDIFVLPSRKEGFPYALLEAMQAGLPIVATNVGGIPEALGDAGMLIKPENPKVLAGAIAYISQNQQKRTELSQKAPERSKLFTEEKMLAETKKVYERVLAG
jgi:glycosyltransferase involved in cell wall biosynthesis